VEIQPTPAVTLDGYCDDLGLGPIDFIRMDIEGGEQKALDGARRLIDRDRPHVQIEIHPAMLEGRFGGTAEGVLEFFLSRGYRMFALNADRLEERSTVDMDLPWKDYFFVHPCRAPELPDGVFKARMAS
jgi:hypothetical protein